MCTTHNEITFTVISVAKGDHVREYYHLGLQTIANKDLVLLIKKFNQLKIRLL